MGTSKLPNDAPFEEAPRAEVAKAASIDELDQSRSSTDAPVDPYLVQRQALRAAAREAALEDLQRRRQLTEASPIKATRDNFESPSKLASGNATPSRQSPNKITHDT